MRYKLAKIAVSGAIAAMATLFAAGPAHASATACEDDTAGNSDYFTICTYVNGSGLWINYADLQLKKTSYNNWSYPNESNCKVQNGLIIWRNGNGVWSSWTGAVSCSTMHGGYGYTFTPHYTLASNGTACAYQYFPLFSQEIGGGTGRQNDCVPVHR